MISPAASAAGTAISNARTFATPATNPMGARYFTPVGYFRRETCDCGGRPRCRRAARRPCP
jgi:hypothetical protein